jgi:hypothetical protein
MQNNNIRLKDDIGRVIEISKTSCYSMNEEGYYITCIKKFSYFRGKETTDPINFTEEDIKNFNFEK